MGCCCCFVLLGDGFFYCFKFIVGSSDVASHPEPEAFREACGRQGLASKIKYLKNNNSAQHILNSFRMDSGAHQFTEQNAIFL